MVIEVNHLTRTENAFNRKNGKCRTNVVRFPENRPNIVEWIAQNLKL